MPKKIPGHVTISVTVPDSMHELIRSASASSPYRKIAPWCAAQLASVLGVEFVPPPLGWQATQRGAVAKKGRKV